MNKICTSIEQSKKLIELGIDVNSADMYWSMDEIPFLAFPVNDIVTDWEYAEENGMLPAWSLTALLNILRAVSENSVELYYTVGNKWAMECYTLNQKCVADEPVDACVGMIEKLHEQNLL